METIPVEHVFPPQLPPLLPATHRVVVRVSRDARKHVQRLNPSTDLSWLIREVEETPTGPAKWYAVSVPIPSWAAVDAEDNCLGKARELLLSRRPLSDLHVRPATDPQSLAAWQRAKHRLQLELGGTYERLSGKVDAFRPPACYFARSMPARTLLWPPVGGEVVTDTVGSSEVARLCELWPDYDETWLLLNTYNLRTQNLCLVSARWCSAASFVRSFPNALSGSDGTNVKSVQVTVNGVPLLFFMTTRAVRKGEQVFSTSETHSASMTSGSYWQLVNNSLYGLWQRASRDLLASRSQRIQAKVEELSSRVPVANELVVAEASLRKVDDRIDRKEAEAHTVSQLVTRAETMLLVQESESLQLNWLRQDMEGAGHRLQQVAAQEEAGARVPDIDRGLLRSRVCPFCSSVLPDEFRSFQKHFRRVCRDRAAAQHLWVICPFDLRHVLSCGAPQDAVAHLRSRCVAPSQRRSMLHCPFNAEHEVRMSEYARHVAEECQWRVESRCPSELLLALLDAVSGHSALPSDHPPADTAAATEPGTSAAATPASEDDPLALLPSVQVTRTPYDALFVTMEREWYAGEASLQAPWRPVPVEPPKHTQRRALWASSVSGRAEAGDTDGTADDACGVKVESGAGEVAGRKSVVGDPCQWDRHRDSCESETRTGLRDRAVRWEEGGADRRGDSDGNRGDRGGSRGDRDGSRGDRDGSQLKNRDRDADDRDRDRGWRSGRVWGDRDRERGGGDWDRERGGGDWDRERGGGDWDRERGRGSRVKAESCEPTAAVTGDFVTAEVSASVVKCECEQEQAAAGGKQLLALLAPVYLSLRLLPADDVVWPEKRWTDLDHATLLPAAGSRMRNLLPKAKHVLLDSLLVKLTEFLNCCFNEEASGLMAWSHVLTAAAWIEQLVELSLAHLPN